MTRFLSGAVLIVIVGAVTLWGPSWLLLALASAVAALAIREYGALASAAGVSIPAGVTTIATLAVCAATALPGSLAGPVVMVVVVAQAAISLARPPRGREDPPDPCPGSGTLAGVSVAVFGPLYVGLPLGSLVAIHAALGPLAALLLIGLIALSDTAQYYGGRLMGRRPLAPVISPRKTVEGALSGIAVGIVAAAILGRQIWPAAPLWFLTALGAAMVVLGIAGDLFESLLKRSVGVKDTSALIPGHGGVLDRIDAILFAAPVYYVVVPYALRT